MIGIRRHLAKARIKAYADREDGGKRLEVHLAECATCRGEVAAFRSLRAAFDELPSPTPRPDLRSQILAARAGGARVILPAYDSVRPLVRWPVVLATGAAALIAGIALSLFPKGSEDTNPAAASFFLAPSAAFAQQVSGAPTPMKYEPLDRLDATNLTSGRWTYQAKVIVDGIVETDRSRRTFTLTRGAYKDRSVWQVTNEWKLENPFGRPGPFVDTILVDGSTLWPIRRAVDRSRGSSFEDFTADSVFGTELVKATPRYPSNTVRGAAAVRHPTVDWMTLKPVLQAAALHSHWRGSVYVTFMQPQRDRVHFPSFTLDLRVVGHERVTVPAGSFDCWRVQASVPAVGTVSPGYSARPSEIWVSRDEHWVIQVRDRFSNDMVFQEQLVEHAGDAATRDH